MPTERTIRGTLKEKREREVESKIQELEAGLADEGYIVTYGTIGQKTTYCMLSREDSDEEVVGYTFIRDAKYKNELLGRLKALQQVIARREMMANKEEDKE